MLSFLPIIVIMGMGSHEILALKSVYRVVDKYTTAEYIVDAVSREVQAVHHIIIAHWC